MKFVIFGGPRSWRAAMVSLGLIVLVALFLGGCGGAGDASDSQLDDGASGESGKAETTIAAGGSVLPGYTEDLCIKEMTARYGNAESAKRVCEAIRTNYGSLPQPPRLATVLPAVEGNLGVTPVPGAPAPTGGNQQSGTPSGGSGSGGGSTTNGSSGWDSGGIEIVVPPAP